MKKRTFKRTVAVTLAAIMSALSLAGCGGDKNADGKIKVRVGDVPVKDTEKYSEYEERRNEFYELHNNVEFEEDTWTYSVDSFLPKAASGDLPCVFWIPLSAFGNIADSGYVADIEDMLKERDLMDKYTKEALDSCKRNDTYYGLPFGMYVLGMILNKDLYKQAGLVDEEGHVKVPQTYDELAESAGIIKEKTGQAGFVIPTMDGGGGWLFTNIAWSFGTEFVEQDEDGKWKATFDSPECEAALQWIKDLKWKYNALSDNAYIDVTESRKMFSVNQAATTFMSPSEEDFETMVVQYGMNKDNVAAANMPEGPAGRYAILGGGMYLFDVNLSKEELDTAVDWIEFNGWGTDASERGIKAMKQRYERYIEENSVIGPQGFNTFNEGEMSELQKKLRDEYINIDMKDFEQYKPAEVITKNEVPICASELYVILDGCVQAVILDKDADVKELLKRAASDYQTNYLNNVE